MKIDRIWAMPNRWTFTIKPIKELLDEEYTDGAWCDPFAGKMSFHNSKYSNDLDPKSPARHHKDSLEFMRSFEDEMFDGVLYDPPYSITQARKYGKKEFASMKYWKDMKDEIARTLKPGGKVICFGWTSQGLGKGRGFEMKRIRLVPHGGSKNDTIVTVEIKK